MVQGLFQSWESKGPNNAIIRDLYNKASFLGGVALGGVPGDSQDYGCFLLPEVLPSRINSTAVPPSIFFSNTLLQEHFSKDCHVCRIRHATHSHRSLQTHVRSQLIPHQKRTGQDHQQNLHVYPCLSCTSLGCFYDIFQFSHFQLVQDIVHQQYDVKCGT